MIVLITVLVALVVLGGIGLLVNAFSKPSQSSANATATANTNITATANANTTGTANTNATGTASANTSANANATGTANANATGTAQTHGNANATATAKANNANATATSQANANATATVAPAAALSGNWVNSNSSTKGITTMNITNNGLNMTVQATSNYPTTDCNWGTKSTQYSSPFTVVFVVSNCGQITTTETLTISTQGPQLKVVDASSTNGSNTYLFNKQ